jgi:ferredoxin-type protein NapH
MFIVPALNLLEIYFIKGTFISFDIGSFGIADPVMILQAVITSASFSVSSAVSALIPALIAFFFGRVWCGWLCPYTYIMERIEMIPPAAEKMKSMRLRLRKSGTVKRTVIIRFFIFIGLLFLAGVCGTPVLHLFSPPAVISTEALLLVKYFSLTAEILLIITLMFIEIFFSYRFACRYLCPTGACLSLFNNSARLRVSYAGSCGNCQKCARICPMGLDPIKDGVNNLCINCGECISVCPDASLSWKIGRG